MNEDDPKQQEETEDPYLQPDLQEAGDAEAQEGGETAEVEGAAPHDDAPPATPEERIEVLESELATQKEQVLRQLAETENVRRRAQREREDTIRYGASALAKDLLNVADNLQRALQAVPAEARESDEVIKNLVIEIGRASCRVRV